MELRMSVGLVMMATVMLAGCTTNMVDIKERAIFKVGRSTMDPVVICAEPSPDAMSAYAAEFIADAAADGKGSAQLAAAVRESAAFVGLRTQSIQLLRDSMYRLCEGYLNQALSEEQFEILMRRSQKYMVALLAIEQMTGAVRVPPVTVTTSGNAALASSLADIISQRKAANERLAQQKEQLTEAEAELATAVKEEKPADTAGTDTQAAAEPSAKVNELENSVGQLKDDIEETESMLELFDKALTTTRTSLLGGDTSAAVYVTSKPNKPSDAVMKDLNKHITELVSTVVTTDDTGAVCLAYASRNLEELGSSQGVTAEKLTTEIVITENPTTENPTTLMVTTEKEPYSFSLDSICEAHFKNTAQAAAQLSSVYSDCVAKQLRTNEGLTDEGLELCEKIVIKAPYQRIYGAKSVQE